MSNPLEVFYIEDDVSIAQAVKEYFEQLNYKVTVFPMIEEAKKAMLKFLLPASQAMYSSTEMPVR